MEKIGDDYFYDIPQRRFLSIHSAARLRPEGGFAYHSYDEITTAAMGSIEHENNSIFKRRK